jgi:drug/metabolite transporter (DMT)-like permease
MTLLEWGLIFALSLAWGASFFFNGIAVKELPVLSVVAGRLTLASAVLLLALYFVGRGIRRSPRLWAAFFIMGMLNNVMPFCLIVWGQSHIASGQAAILNATTPFFTVIGAHVLTIEEKLTGGRIAGVLIGLVGVTIMMGSDVLRSLATHVTAQMACLAAALSYACAAIYGRRFRSMGVSAIEMAAGQVTVSSLLVMPVVLLIDKPWLLPLPGLATIAALVAIAVLSTALAYVLYFRILATAGPTNLLLVTFLIPVSAIALGAAGLNEALAPQHYVGMAMIACGLAAIDGRPWLMAVRAVRSPARRAVQQAPAGSGGHQDVVANSNRRWARHFTSRQRL